jgi:hypothetical protein
MQEKTTSLRKSYEKNILHGPDKIPISTKILIWVEDPPKTL